MLYAHILQWPKRVKVLSQYSWHKYNVIKPLPFLIFYAWKKITVGYLRQITAGTITWQWISMDTINEHLVVYPMDVSVLFWHCHILNFQLQINVIKSDDKPRVESHLMLFQQILSLSDAWASRQSSKQLPEQAWTLISYPLCKLFQFDLLLGYSFLGSYKYLIVMGSKDVQLAQSGCIWACQFKLAQSIKVCLQRKNFLN